MRLGVLDVGSNTVHLLVVDAHRGGHPIPTFSEKSELRLAELLRPAGALSRRGEDRLIEAICAARESAEHYGTEDLVAFATSAVRDATNSESVLARVRAETGVALAVLTGPDEARMTFLAVRRWLGWSAGRLLVLDIGGGSLEIAGGIDEEPDVALSLPLGAGRLTRERLSGDPPRGKEVAALRQHVRTALAPLGPVLVEFGAPDRAVATSKTFRSLARLGGAAPYSRGPRVRRTLSAEQLADILPRIAKLTAAQRGTLDGVSPSRAHQLLAGAVVAESAMAVFGVAAVEICPWALREGVILQRLDWLHSA
jgi:exopolyphosphatase / guanosine-5'-triphosphate,3'-diphosphate pyrophosphatase